MPDAYSSLADIDITTPPANALERFLCADIATLEEDVALIGYVVFVIKRARVKLQKELASVEATMERREREMFLHYLGSENPATGRIYTADGAKAASRLDSTYQGWLGAYIELKQREGEMMAYEEGLKAKIAITPGLQGRANRLE